MNQFERIVSWCVGYIFCSCGPEVQQSVIHYPVLVTDPHTLRACYKSNIMQFQCNVYHKLKFDEQAIHSNQDAQK